MLGRSASRCVSRGRQRGALVLAHGRADRALLEEHDDAHGTELAATAEAVARAYGDLRLAAEALHQHPNTVRYRLRKAKDVLGMPDSPDREFASCWPRVSGLHESLAAAVRAGGGGSLRGARCFLGQSACNNMI